MKGKRMRNELGKHVVLLADVKLRKENRKLREALEFYADVHKYPAPFTGGMGDLWSDCGKIARVALGEEK